MSQSYEFDLQTYLKATLNRQNPLQTLNRWQNRSIKHLILEMCHCDADTLFWKYNATINGVDRWVFKTKEGHQGSLVMNASLDTLCLIILPAHGRFLRTMFTIDRNGVVIVDSKHQQAESSLMKRLNSVMKHMMAAHQLSTLPDDGSADMEWLVRINKNSKAS